MVYATIIKIIDYDKKNLLLIFLLPILLFFLITTRKIDIKQLFKKNYFIVWVFSLYLVLSSIVNFDRLRLSSLAYSLDLVICFVMYTYLVGIYINIKDYSKWLVWIIGLFFTALVIQQSCILLGYDDFFNNLGHMTYQVEDNRLFSLNSLSTEPSYAATIVSVSFYSLLRIQNRSRCYTIKNLRQDAPIWIMYIYQLIFYRSVFGVMFFLIICFYLIDFKRVGAWLLLGAATSLLIGISANYTALMRLQSILKGFDVHNIAALASIDHSGSIRILPFYYYIVNFNYLDFHTYLGYGMDYAQTYLGRLIPGIPEGAAFGGVLPLFPFDFGIIGFWLFWKILAKFSYTRFFSVEVLMLCMVMVNATFNTQLFWYVVIIFAINKMVTSSHQANIQPIAIKI